jgi:predicted nucleotidyltransferase
MTTSEDVNQIVQAIVSQFHPRRIILFGSQARGEAGPDSDLDLLVEMETTLPRREQVRRIRRSFDPYPCAMDIVVYTPDEVRKWAQAPASLVATVMREGRILYEQ